MTEPRDQASDPLRILVIGAHPDDCEFRCGGVAALWAARGHRVRFLSVTDGGAGHHAQGGAPLVQRRAAEAAAAAATIGIESRILPIPDGYLEPRLDYRLMVVREIREFRADLVITNRPNDYHPDHRYTALLVQDSAFLLVVPHVAPETPALRKNPVILYWSDSFKKPTPFQPDLVIDIDPVVERKIAQLHCHASQIYEWLPWLAGRLDSVPADDATRLAWLREWYESRHTPSIADRYRASLAARYGAVRAAAVRQAEAFELCEYGSPLDERAMERLFAGL